MPTIDFYILPSVREQERLMFACRLTEKIYQQQHRIYIHTESQAAMRQLDQLLWTYREDSFLPHHVDGEKTEPLPPIQIGYDTTPEKHQDILINLSPAVPAFYRQFNRVLELVSHDASIQAAGRERYKSYRAEGHPITTHKLETLTD